MQGGTLASACCAGELTIGFPAIFKETKRKGGNDYDTTNFGNDFCD